MKEPKISWRSSIGEGGRVYRKGGHYAANHAAATYFSVWQKSRYQELRFWCLNRVCVLSESPFATTALNLFAKGEDDSAVKSFISGVNGPGSFERLPPKIQEHMLLNAHEMRAELRMPPERFFPVFTCDDARRITMPVLLLTGANSPSFFRAILDRLRDCVPSSSETEIPAASHGVQYENPEAFNDVLLKFIDTSPEE
jgi:pimeloyl-ACP methyl ester carboxylesterase